MEEREKETGNFESPKRLAGGVVYEILEEKKERCVPVAAQRGFAGASAGPARPIPPVPFLAALSPWGFPLTFLNLKSLRGRDRLVGMWNTKGLYKSPGYRLTQLLSFSLRVLPFCTLSPSIPLSLSFIAPSLLLAGTSDRLQLSVFLHLHNSVSFFLSP